MDSIQRHRDLALGVLPMVPFILGAVLAWWAPAGYTSLALRATLIWGGAILAFLAGVRRGLTLRSPDGETMPQIATMFVLFGLAAGSLLTPLPGLSAVMLIAGFLCVAVFDWRAVLKEEVPPSFARLRPVQMLVPILSLASLWPLLDIGTR